MSRIFSRKNINELSNNFTNFDFDAAIEDILNWQDELDLTDIEDSVVFSTLESVLDIIIDRSEF